MIIAIHNGDSIAQPKNSRPKSLTAHLTKTFEKVICSRVVDFCEQNNLFNKTEDGFRTDRACLSELLEHGDNILHELENDNNTDGIYFAKAFNKMDHRILCHNLKSLGIGENLEAGYIAFSTVEHKQ